MRFAWRLAVLSILALTCILLGMSLRVSFEWLDLEGADDRPGLVDRRSIGEMRRSLLEAEDPFEPVIRVAEVVRPSVVSIEVVPSPALQRIRRTNLRDGSGVVWDEDGHIVTNWHVIGETEPARILVRMGLEERAYEATYVGHDAFSDLAVIEVDGARIVPAELGDSDSIRVGQAAIAVGSPFALQGTVTLGLVSSIARQVETGNKEFDLLGAESYIQTDAAINPGNSGGPLVDIRGRVIGINTMILTETSAGVGFAIPINYARHIVGQIIEKGTVSRGGLGISLQEQAPGRRMPVGAHVEVVGPGTPAHRAGVRPGDVIVEYDSKRIRNNDDLVRQVQKTELGHEVRLVVRRDERFLTLYPVIGERARAIEAALEARNER